VGESLRTIRANPPLEQVTTGSLEALQKYTRALQVSKQGDLTREVELLQEAVAADTAFAMAYRRLAVALRNSGGGRARSNAAASAAYEHRNRLTELERYIAVAYYHSVVDVDRDKVISSYRSALEIDPDNHHALNNLAVALGRQRQWEEAEELAVRAVAVDDEPPHYYTAIGAKVALGKFEEAKTLLQKYAEAWSSEHPSVASLHAALASAQRNFEASRDHLERLRATQRSLVWQSEADFGLFALAQAAGKLNDAERHIHNYMDVSERRGLAAAYVSGAAELGLLDVWYREAPAKGLRAIEQALEKYPLSEMAAPDRPYLSLASVYAIADRPGRAKELLAEYEAEVDEAVTRNSARRHEASAYVALAEGRIDEARDGFRERYDRSGCPTCALFHLASTYELAGEPDSALAIYERAVSTPGLYRIYDEYATIAQTYRRLGQLYEGRGEREKAVEYYDRFVNLWSDADPELQPVVRDVRARIADLVGERLN
jgi:tetratricopeptide (TPR) repeat protein